MKKGLLLLIACLCISTGVRAQLVTGVSLVTPPDTLFIGQEIILKATIQPSNAANKAVTWTSSDATVIQIVSATDTICKLRSVAGGLNNATITVTTTDGGFTATKNIITDFPPVSSVKISEKNIDLVVNEIYTLSATVLPALAVNKNVTWEVVDEMIAHVFQDGKVLAKKLGTTKVIVTTADGGKKDTCEVKVSVHNVSVTGVQLDKDEINLTEGNATSLKAQVLPEVASNKSVKWTTSNSDVATVSIDGVVFAKKEGKAFIFVTTEDGSFRDSCTVKVAQKLVSIDTTGANSANGKFGLYLNIPEKSSIKTGSFLITLPEGFTLDKNKTQLTEEFAGTSSLEIMNTIANQWKVIIVPKSTKSALRANADTKILDIAYSAGTSTPSGVYDIMLKDIDFKLTDETVINESYLSTKIKITVPTGKETIENENIKVYMSNGNLLVNTPQAEIIYAYSIQGKLVFSKNKSEGEASFDINTQDQILIIKGSTGWVRKISK